MFQKPLPQLLIVRLQIIKTVFMDVHQTIAGVHVNLLLPAYPMNNRESVALDWVENVLSRKLPPARIGLNIIVTNLANNPARLMKFVLSVPGLLLRFLP